MKNIVIAAFCMIMSISVNAEEKTLSKDEAQALFSNKTFDGINEEEGKSFQVYSSADGVHNLKKANGKMKQGTWSIDNKGRHCIEFGRKKCASVVTDGSGVYKKMRHGEVTHTLKNFVDGDQL